MREIEQSCSQSNLIEALHDKLGLLYRQAHFDRQGKSHKAFCLPQEDPRHNVLLLKSYNVPELTRDAVRVSEPTLRECIYHTDGEQAKYLR